MFAWILAGLATGYVFATVWESLMHRLLGHATGRALRLIRRLPWVASTLSMIHYSHAVVHHARTFHQDHVHQFSSASEKELLDQELHHKGLHELIAVQYGLITNLLGSIYFMAIPMAATLMICLVLTGRLLPDFLIPAGLLIISPPLLSRFVHPLLHCPEKEVRIKAGPLIAWIIRSPYGRWARKSHYVHHRHPAYNFNLLPGGDFLLGTHRTPTPGELADMTAIGLLSPTDERGSPG